jgi:opacity protein-like surface antigen
MYRNLITVAFAGVLFSTTAMAQDVQLKPYVEGQISHVMIDDNDGSISASAGGFNAAATGVFQYDDATAFGVEVGLASIGGAGFRAGLSYTTFDAELEAVDGSAAVSFNGTVLLAAAGRVTADQLRAAGADIGEEVKVFSVNTYYDFDLGSNFKPYLGLGVGMADIENMKDNELALSGYAGVNYAVTENLYAGLRASIHHVEESEDELGIKYDDFRTYAVGAVIGYKF